MTLSVRYSVVLCIYDAGHTGPHIDTDGKWEGEHGDDESHRTLFLHGWRELLR